MSKQAGSTAWDFVQKVVAERRSTRAFLDAPVAKEEIQDILDKAQRAPSGGNLQPWKVHVVIGCVKERLEQKLRATYEDRSYQEEDQYNYYPDNLPDEFSRRREYAGEQLYKALGINRRDVQARRALQADNYGFFGAPAGLIFTIPKILAQGSWLDMGIFVGNVMLLAEAKGLATCPQASFISYHKIIRNFLNFGKDELLVCGMAIGYADQNHPLNAFRSPRRSVTDFITFHDQEERLQPLSSQLAEHISRNPCKVAFRSDGKPVSYAELGVDISAARGYLKTKSPKGSSIALSRPNSREFLSFFMAAVSLGRCVKVFDPYWPDIKRNKAKFLSKPDMLIDQTVSFAGFEDNVEEQSERIDVPFYAGFTSGSTGEPKGFVRSQRSWLESFRCDTEEFGLNAGDVIAAPGQFAHSLPLYAVLRALYEGATALFYTSFHPGRILDDLERNAVSVIYAVPTQLQAFVDHAGDGKTFTSVRLVLSSGAKCPDPLRKELRRTFPEATFAEFYGSSELSYITVAKENEDPPEGSVGRAFGQVKIDILDMAGQKVQAGVVGQICVQSPYRFIGYEGGTGEAGEEAFLTGDIGYLDESGYLYITGRRDRMIAVSARNIFPEEVERCLQTHPHVIRAAVFGVKDRKRGNRLVAVVELDNAGLTAATLRTHCAKSLSAYTIPSRFYHLEDWPLTLSGKIDFPKVKTRLEKQELQELS